MDPEKLMDGIAAEMEAALAAMAVASTVEEKKEYSEIIHNLSQSLGVFLRMASDMLGLDMDDFDDDEPF